MKIAILGTGAVGGYLGGRLAQAGQAVSFIARGPQLGALVTDGLQVKSINGDFSIHPVNASDRPEDIGKVDLVLCCVKSWQVPKAADAIKSLIGPETVVIPIQNGVESHGILAQALGGEHVLPGLCRMISMVEGPGRIRHAGADPYLAFGELDGRSSRRTEKVAALFADARGLTVDVSKTIIPDLWKKFMLIASWSGLGAITRSPIGVIRSLPETRDMLTGSIREVFDVARGNGVALEEGVVAATIAFIDRLPPEGTASMQRDIMKGRASELHEQCGAVVKYGEKAGVNTAVNRFIYHSLLPLERKARGEISL
jgi:2-dehydropantoate 2-reductase